MRVLILDNGDPSPGNLLEPLRELGAECDVLPSGSLDLDDIREMRPRVRRILMSPGPGVPEETGVCLRVATSLAGEIPVLGIGIGMLAILQVAQGALVPSPGTTRETATVRHDSSNLFAGLPSPMEVPRDRSVRLTLDGRKRVPHDLEVSARDENGTALGCRVWGLGIEGFLVDTSWFSTPQGRDMLFNFLFQSQTW